MKQVIIYSTETCHFCHVAKEYFKNKNIAFTDYDVGKNAEKRNEMVELTGQLGVPVIHIGDTVLIGFEEKKIEALLVS